MKKAQKSSTRFFAVFLVSVFIAVFMALQTMPEKLFYFWPEWIAMVLIFWALYFPEKMTPLLAFFVGLLCEVLLIRGFGVLGFGYAIVVYIVNTFSLPMRVLSRWQQSFVVAILLVVFKLIVGWFYGLLDGFVLTTSYLYSAFSSMLIWPVFLSVMTDYQRALLR